MRKRRMITFTAAVCILACMVLTLFAGSARCAQKKDERRGYLRDSCGPYLTLGGLAEYQRWGKPDVDNRYLGAERCPDKPPGWDGKLSKYELASIRSAGESVNRFAFDMYELLSHETGGNILFSPYDLAMTLMKHYKTSDAKTKKELHRALYLDKDSPVNFWLLASAIENTPEDIGGFRSSGGVTYFKSDWEFPFDRYEGDKTSNPCFQTIFHQTEALSYPMYVMRQDQRVRYCEDGEVKSFEFPFIDRYYSYIVILPQRKHGVREIESKLSFGRFKYLLANQRDRNIEVRLAETKVSSSYDFGGRLAMLGLSSLADTRPRQINKFDLYGGEQLRASSNTWRVLRLWSPVPTEDPFNVDRSFKPDHPFIYFVVDNRSGVIMFMGRYSGE